MMVLARQRLNAFCHDSNHRALVAEVYAGGGCRMPPSYVPYKGTYVLYDGTFGTPDQGQMLDV